MPARAWRGLRIMLVLMAGVLGLAGPAGAAGQRVALVIGNSAYRHLPRLANPANDAALVGGTLKDLGFELVGGGVQLDLDKAGFARAVQQFGAALQTAEVGLFYYAGHGLQVQGTNWLVPVGADPAGPQDLDFQMVDAELVLKQMQYAKTRLNIVILDACRNNPFAGRGLRAAQGGLAEMRAPQGALIAYSTQPGNVARDGSGANSPFSAALARSLRQPGLDVFRLFNQVGLAVQRETGGDQQPWVSSSPIDGDFYFSAPAGGAAPPAADAELIFWQAIDGSPDPSDYAAYLRRYPQGRFAELAQRRLPVPSTPQPPRAPEPAPVPGGSWQQALGGLPWLRPGPQPAAPKPAPAAASLFLTGVRALNDLNRSVESSYGDYARTFDPERGPSGRESSARLSEIDGSQVTATVAAMRAALEQASGDLVPGIAYAEVREMYTRLRWPHPVQALPLAVALQRYLDAFERLRRLQADAAPYYRQESYRDDRFAGARAMHPGLVGGYREVLNAGEALTQAVLLQAPHERERFLASKSGDDRLMMAAMLRSVAQGRRLLGFIAASLDARPDYRTIDTARLQQEIAPFEQSVGEVRAFVLPQAAGAAFSMRNHHLASFLERGERLLASAKHLWRGARDRQPLTDHYFQFRTGAEFDIFARFDDLTGTGNLLLAPR